MRGKGPKPPKDGAVFVNVSDDDDGADGSIRKANLAGAQREIDNLGV
jgi:hypothetical protein